MVYFTSDLHLGHPAIIGMQNRIFENVEEMNRALIENYNLQNRKDGIRRYDVGVAANEFKPVAVNEIIEFFNI